MAELLTLDLSSSDVLSLACLQDTNLKLKQVRKLKKRRQLRAKVFHLSDPIISARHAGLRYVTDNSPGIRRVRSGKGFSYQTPEGERIRDAKFLERIKALAIPPAWEDVWICMHAEGHLQATGRDSRGRKQYRYHPRWREVRDLCKFDRMVAFGDSLPFIRDRVDQDLSATGMPRTKVLATIVSLLEMSLIRVGNDEYAKQNGSYGLTTLRNHHVKVYGSKIQFRFKGKGGKLHVVGIRNKRLARIIQKCQEIPGYELFQYIDPEGNTVSVDSSDVNAYLREITEQDFTAKDFRTWAATVLMGMALQMRRESRNGNGPTKKDINEAVSNVSRLLGNTPAVCRKSYIHPVVIDAYTDGKLDEFWDKYVEQQSAPGLAKEEALMLSFLRKCQN